MRPFRTWNKKRYRSVNAHAQGKYITQTKGIVDRIMKGEAQTSPERSRQMAGTEAQRPLLYYKCTVCKKKFTTYSAVDGWVYFRNDGKKRRWFCGYNCMREWERKKVDGRKTGSGRKKLKGEQYCEYHEKWDKSRRKGAKKNDNDRESNTGE